jgi:hypothetical protein
MADQWEWLENISVQTVDAVRDFERVVDPYLLPIEASIRNVLPAQAREFFQYSISHSKFVVMIIPSKPALFPVNISNIIRV